MLIEQGGRGHRAPEVPDPRDHRFRGTDVGAGEEVVQQDAVVDRLRSFRDAGVTDLAVRVLPLGADRNARIESKNRTLALLSSLCPEL